MSRPELFDAAINKAHTYALRLGLPLDDPDKLRGGLELWYLKTRFAYRIPLETLIEPLLAAPRGVGEHYLWQGGPNGSWKAA